MKKILLLITLLFCASIFSQEQNTNTKEIAQANNSLEKNLKEEKTKKLPTKESSNLTIDKEQNVQKIENIEKNKNITLDENNLENNDLNAEEMIQAEPEEVKRPGTSLFELFKLGGVFMWPLLLFSILVFAVILERGIVFYGYKFNVLKTCEPAIKELSKGNFAKAISIIKENEKCFASDIIIKSISFLEKNKIKEFEKHIETSSTVKIAQLERNQNILSTMGNIAPLTGFLGTVSGMIAAFKTIALSDNVTARLVAGGIYEALITTAFGLIIAIIAVGGNNFFVHKIDNTANEITECANLMIESVSE